ncbi:hypothetical protein FisN_2Lh351 [Fistulifera solaris]|uniref:TraB family protein n=1 Tax=Fistulifera solaris TaxID=1519565 RepID=A0A1Z5J846_FISSO|nr:hypothetical protein FisN_2Lh351 [Fistulifera solaris]|eukprot:GAX10082.1 hypothetical protein FisN_2Lh351 [Fistulifera solaris]
MTSLLKRSLILFLFVANAGALIPLRSPRVERISRITPTNVSFSTTANNSEKLNTSKGQSRRQWISNVGKAAIVPFLLPSPSFASTAVVSSKAVCDSTVSVWKEPNRNRLVYILGTAHISKVSADLARQLVRDVHPNAVFVELDLKRVNGVAQYVQQQQDLKDSIEQVTLPPGTRNMPLAPLAADTPPKQSTVIVPVPTTPIASEETPPSPRRGLFGGLRQKALSVGAQVVGSAVRGMYQNLGDQGFSPGEEFAAAIMEAQKQGADVILGDQDVQITLRRLTQALASTDLSKLNDDALSSKFSDLMGGGKAMELPPSGVMDDKYKEELTKMVESMKNRENVRAIMTELKEVAPALAQVMLTERDAYMATGIDTLNQFECIVAVMGIAHMDGVENNLKGRGWTQVAPNCAAF